ncbi:dolichyl pyrophosphate Man9GlcNAc2 alpha-1,3-glucosyltransferase-like [Saccostrea cucullata]|uniref:dolichyl pyrophosphate Man9GlcNAc2 alpha-1,3-glucosyltransferase-like n=1 Tax=Saccostrea cuccullata TaxID=36930 RepID=UPI002ED20128
MYKSAYVVALLVAVLVRWLVSLHKYSGAEKPPMFGDYEAQRHWMEITYHLPPQQWYFNGVNNNLSYWGLDYPPLTAYHSWLCGAVAHKINPSWVALKESHGHESYAHKLFMRYTVEPVAIHFFQSCLFFFFSLLTTLLCLLPSSIHLLCVPSDRNFRIALVNSSLVFFLFSFHVHEKSILLPALAISLLIHEHPFWCVWFYFISIFSMLPLFIKDDLVVPAFATTALHALVCGTCLTLNSGNSDQPWERIKTVMMKLSMVGALCMTVAHLCLTPPPRYPDLFPVLVSIYSCAHFVLFLIVFHCLQFQFSSNKNEIKKVQ